MVFQRGPSGIGPGWGWAHGWQTTAYRRHSEGGEHNSIVAAQLNWITNNLHEAERRVRRRNAKGQLEPVISHPLLDLLDEPNGYYSGEILLDATYRDWRRGNAYWILIRGGSGLPVQAWWAPRHMVEPIGSDTVFIDHYDYRPVPDRDAIRLDPQDVIHFRNGMDAQNPRKGTDDFAAILNEIATDDEGSAWTQALLANNAGPHVLISGDDEQGIDEPEAEKIKVNYLQKTTGEHRGEPLVISGKTKVSVMSFNPTEMDMRTLRRVPEERISAVIGVPAIVCGLGAGLDRSTFSNMREAKESATENVLIPAWRFLAKEIQRQLMPQLADPKTFVFDFDLSTVRALADDQNALWNRIDKALAVGGITLNESLVARGMETIPNGDVYYLPINLTPTPVDQIGAPPAPPAPPVPNPTPPPAKVFDVSLLGFKAGDAWVGSMERLHQNLSPGAQRELGTFLERQRQRVISNLSSGKAAPATPLDWNAEDQHLTEVLNKHYLRGLGETTKLMNQYIQADITVDDATVKSYLRTAGTHISGINTTTRHAIQQTLAEGQALNEDVGQLAARIEGLTQFSSSRAETIALTELGSAQALATSHVAQLAGIKQLQIHDPDGSDGTFTGCVDRHGQIVSTVDSFNAGLLHPRCRMVLVPLVRAPATQRSFDPSELVTVVNGTNGHTPHRIRKSIERDGDGRITAVIEERDAGD